MDDKALSQDKDKDKQDIENLENLNKRINEKDNNKKKYSKKIQKTFDENEERKENENENEKIIININLIAIIYKKNEGNYNFEFIIIKNNNEINIEKFNNDKSIYVYHDRSKIISNCNNFKTKFTNNDVYNIFLNIIKKNSKNILYTLSYIFNDITYNIRLSIPIIIILTNVNRLIMIDYSNHTPNDKPNDTPNDIDLILLSIISKQLFTTITKYLKDNFETELGRLYDTYHNNNNIFNIIDINNNQKIYRKSNNIDSIINKNTNDNQHDDGVDI
jgi:hypothetical protein